MVENEEQAQHLREMVRGLNALYLECPDAVVNDVQDRVTAYVQSLRAEIARAIADKDEMVRRNALLRERPDLPVDRIPAHEELVRLQAELDRLKVAPSEGEIDAMATAAFRAYPEKYASSAPFPSQPEATKKYWREAINAAIAAFLQGRAG